MVNCNVRFEDLVNYADGSASPAESARINAHLAGGCSLCQEQLAFIRQTIVTLRSVFEPTESVPPERARAFARNLTRLRFPEGGADTHAPESRGVLPVVKRWVAKLVAPQALTPAETRSTFASPGKSPAQRLYETSDYLVTLWEEANTDGKGSYVIGQVYCRRENVSLQPELVLFTATYGGEQLLADHEQNEFYVPDLMPGNYVVRCWLEGHNVLALNDVVIGNV